MNTKAKCKKTAVEQSTDLIIEKVETVVSLWGDNISTAITDQGDYVDRTIFLQDVKKKYREVESDRVSIVKPLNDVIKSLNDRFKTPLSRLKDIESTIKGVILGYDHKMEEIRRKAQKKIDDLAEKKRLKAEEKAEKLREEGKEDKADEVIQKIVDAPIKQAVTTYPKAKSVTRKDCWKFRVINKALVIQHHPEHIILDEQKIGAIGRASKGTAQIVGIEFYNEPIITSRC